MTKRNRYAVNTETGVVHDTRTGDGRVQDRRCGL